MPFGIRLQEQECDYISTAAWQPFRITISAMMKDSVKQTVMGTRSGYVIRFTCHACNTENSMVFNNPKDFYKESRDGKCSRCQKRFTVLTPRQY
jgi:hypothetical protein